MSLPEIKKRPILFLFAKIIITIVLLATLLEYILPREYTITPDSWHYSWYQETDIPELTFKGVLCGDDPLLVGVAPYAYYLKTSMGYIEILPPDTPPLSIRRFIGRKVKITGKWFPETSPISKVEGVYLIPGRIQKRGIFFNAYQDIQSFFIYLYYLYS